MALQIILWFFFATCLSFGISALFSGRLQWQRNRYLITYIVPFAVFLSLYFNWSEIDWVKRSTNHWQWGIVGAIAAGVILLKHVYSQPSSPRHQGLDFIIDLVWAGLFYGLIDALLLSVFPVHIVQQLLAESVWTESFFRSAGTAGIALLFSLIITFCYHFGYREYRGKQIAGTLVGNGILTIAFLITGSPLAAVLPHIAMHLAAVTHARDTTHQLPPHYQEPAMNQVC